MSLPEAGRTAPRSRSTSGLYSEPEAQPQRDGWGAGRHRKRALQYAGRVTVWGQSRLGVTSPAVHAMVEMNGDDEGGDAKWDEEEF